MEQGREGLADIEDGESTTSTEESSTTSLREELDSVQWYPLRNLTSVGPKESKRPYASICIIDPVITVERHDEKYHVAVRFNMETTILHYETQKW